MPYGKCDLCEFHVEDPSWDKVVEIMKAHYTDAHPAPPPVAEKGEEWEERTPEFMTFEVPGDFVMGILERLETVSMHDRDVRRAVVKTADGIQSFLLTTQLESLIIGIPTGQSIKVLYVGEIKSSKGRRVKTFRVWVKR